MTRRTERSNAYWTCPGSSDCGWSSIATRSVCDVARRGPCARLALVHDVAREMMASTAAATARLEISLGINRGHDRPTVLSAKKKGLPLAGAPCARRVTVPQIGPGRQPHIKERIECRHSRPPSQKKARQCRHWRAFVTLLTKRSAFPGQLAPPRGSEQPAPAASCSSPARSRPG